MSKEYYDLVHTPSTRSEALQFLDRAVCSFHGYRPRDQVKARQEFLSLANKICAHLSPLTVEDKLELCAKLYSFATAKTLRPEVTPHAENHVTRLASELAADEITAFSISADKNLWTEQDRQVRLAAKFQESGTMPMFYVGYTQEIRKRFQTKPDEAIRFAASISHKYGRQPFPALCSELLQQAAAHYNAEEETKIFLEIAEAGIEGANDNGNWGLRTRLKKEGAYIFVGRLINSPSAVASKHGLENTSEILKQEIPHATAIFGKLHYCWSRLSYQMQREYGLT